MTPPWPRTAPTAEHRRAYADATPRSYWLDTLPVREPHPPPQRMIEADLCIVGGGYTGLWAALDAKKRDPGREVVVLEAAACGSGASGRNGGFLSSSLTHGIENGLSRFAGELPELERLGLESFSALRADQERHAIEAEYEATGTLELALEPHELEGLQDGAELLRSFGHEAEVLDREAVRAQVDSPTCLGAIRVLSGAALVHPAKLGDGLRAAASRAGVQIFEHTAARSIGRAGVGVVVHTDEGRVGARGALLATSAYPPLLAGLHRYIAPVYHYALVTEPLDERRRATIGWRGRQGLSDGANQFHYYRSTADDRILYGGFDAVYRCGGPVGSQYDDHAPTFARLARHLFTTFPQLEGCASPTAGAARSTPAAASRRSSARSSTAASPTPSATPDSASAPRASAPARRSICSTAVTAPRPGSPTCARVRCRSRASRFDQRSCS